MPKKTIREMSDAERMHFSLAARTFHMILMASLVLGLVAFIVGVGLYTIALGGQYSAESYSLARSASSIIDKVVDIRPYATQVMNVYNSLTDEELEVQDEEYFARYDGIVQDENYQMILELLDDFYESSEVGDIYIGMYDEERNILVYIAGADQHSAEGYKMGQWELVSYREARKFLHWDNTGRLYHISGNRDLGWVCTSGYPVYNQDGSINCFVLSDVTLGGIRSGIKNFTLQYSVAVAIMTVLLGYFITRHMKRTMVTPINQIAEAAYNYAVDKKAGGSETDHFGGLDISTGDEIENLWFILSDMEKDLNKYEEDLTTAVKEKERIGTELNLATRIQEGMLPSRFPAFPGRNDFDIYASMIPAKEVGGDFYDYFLIDDDHLGIVMADVSGKGVPAALFMMASKILIKNVAMTLKDPGLILESVNRQITSNNSQEMFVTVWLGILDLKTGVLKAANAGHEYPIIKHADKDFTIFRDKHGFVVGGMEGMKYKDYEISLEPGSKIFVYTDGAVEAVNSDNGMFGMDRLLGVLNDSKDCDPLHILKNVEKSVKKFAGEAEQFDDLTMLCLHYKGTDTNNPIDSEGEKIMKEMTIEATVENISKVTDFVNAELESLDCPLKAQMQIDVAIDELFGNIAYYAYNPETGPATVRVEVEEDPMAVIITFIDNGKPYDPLAAKDPDITLGADEREVGGLGVFLVKKTMDEITYEYKNGQNILRIRKNM